MPEFLLIPKVYARFGASIWLSSRVVDRHKARFRRFSLAEFLWFHSYGRTRVVQVLQGSRAREIRDTHLPQLSTYGILKGSPREMIDGYLEALIGAGCIDIVGDEYPKLEITDYGQAVMRRRQDIQLPLPPLVEPKSRQALGPARQPRPAEREGAAGAISSLGVESDPALLQRLQALRRTLAEAESLPAYCIVQNRTLQELAQRQPADPHALLQIHGIGKEKARKYGDILLEAIRAHLAAGRREGD